MAVRRHGRRPPHRRAAGVMNRAATAAVWLTLALAAAPAVGQEVANVQLGGETVFPVSATGEVRAAVRAQQIRDSLTARLESDRALAPITVVSRDTGAALVIAGDTLVRVTVRDAEVFLGRAVETDGGGAVRQVALEWADALADAFRRRLLEERARVVVEGTPLFEVGGTPELRAARRAEAIGVRVAELAAMEAPPPVQVWTDGAATAVVAGEARIVEVDAVDAARRDTTAAAVAQDWAVVLQQTVDRLRAQRSWRYRLRLILIVIAATFAAAIAHHLLRRAGRALARRLPGDRALGLLPVLAEWGASVTRFVIWAALGAFIVWLVPRTRPLAFAAGAEGLATARDVVEWLLGSGLILGMIVVATIFVGRFAGAVARRLVQTFGARQGGRAELRAETLLGTVSAAAQTLVAFIGLIVVLGWLRIDPLPLVASAGVAGIAIGFGVQTLIRDFFTGLFILLEDQYGVGDLIQLRGTTGKVERFTLRITQVRGLDGSLTSIPNGEITTVTNLSKDWSQVVLDVNIKLGEDVDRAIAVITETAESLAREWGDRIQGEPEVLGVETVDPATETVTIRIVIRTAPLERWAVSRELRRRVLDAFRDEAIQVPPRAIVTSPNQRTTPDV